MKPTQIVSAALVCETCNITFERTGKRGPIPRNCLDCRADIQRAQVRESAQRRRARDPKGEAEKSRRWREQNGELVRRWDRDRHERDKEKRNAASRAWHSANAERGRALARASISRQRDADLDEYRAKKAEQASRRRARIAKVAVDSFRHNEVFERDSWVCQLCGGPVDRSKIFPHPDSPSLDHVVPISRGGEHSRANAQCAHLSCNIKKGNRPWPTTDSRATPLRFSAPRD